MANLLRRNGSHDDRTLAPSHHEDTLGPYRMMRELMRWDPLREMMPSMFGNEQMFSPAFEVAEHKDRYVFSADLPGVKDRDVDIKLTGNRLTVSGKRETEHEDRSDTYYACERTYGSFSRSFTLPADAVDLEHISAKLDGGVLTIAIPKKASAESKSIPLDARRPD